MKRNSLFYVFWRLFAPLFRLLTTAGAESLLTVISGDYTAAKRRRGHGGGGRNEEGPRKVFICRQQLLPPVPADHSLATAARGSGGC